MEKILLRKNALKYSQKTNQEHPRVQTVPVLQLYQALRQNEKVKQILDQNR